MYTISTTLGWIGIVLFFVGVFMAMRPGMDRRKGVGLFFLCASIGVFAYLMFAPSVLHFLQTLGSIR